MRSLLVAALGLMAAVAQPAQATPRTETLYVRPHGTIAAFAQDRELIAWFEPGRTRCNAVHVLSLGNGLNLDLPMQDGARNVTCRWQVVQPVGLALAAKTSDVVWTLRREAPYPFDYILGAGVRDRNERRFQEIARSKRGAGLWLGGVAGDRSTLVYAVTVTDYKDEAGCLAGTSSCALRLTGGGIYRLVGRQPPKLVEGTGPALAVAASGRTIAYIPTASIGKDSRPAADAGLRIPVLDAFSGRVLAQAATEGTPIAVALSRNVLAALEQTPSGLRLAWYASATGDATGSVAVPADAGPELTASDQRAVFRVGRTIYSVDFATSRLATLAEAAATPIGLSLEGGRLAWAENLKGGARIRALYVGGRG